MNILVEEVARAFKSFPYGSSYGPDGLDPKHLNDIMGWGLVRGANNYSRFYFIYIILRGDTPDFIIPFFFGTSLIGVSKRGGGI